MNEASVNLLKQNNGMKEIFSNNFFLSTFQSYHPLRENTPTIQISIRCFASNETKSLQIGDITLKNLYFSTID